MTQLCFHFADLDTQAQKTVNLLFTITSEEMQSWVCEASEDVLTMARHSENSPKPRSRAL